MQAVVWDGVDEISVGDGPDPKIQDPRTGAIDPSTIPTRVADLPSAPDAYASFDRREAGRTTVALDPDVR